MTARDADFLFGDMPIPKYTAQTGVMIFTVVSDSTAPATTVTSYPARSSDPFVLEVTDIDPGIGYVGLFVTVAGSTDELTVYRRGRFVGAFLASSVEVIANGYRFTIYRVGGWPAGTVRFSVDAIDGLGNLDA